LWVWRKLCGLVSFVIYTRLFYRPDQKCTLLTNDLLLSKQCGMGQL
jgi:hypothetical protein